MIKYPYHTKQCLSLTTICLSTIVVVCQSEQIYPRVENWEKERKEKAPQRRSVQTNGNVSVGVGELVHEEGLVNVFQQVIQASHHPFNVPMCTWSVFECNWFITIDLKAL